MKKKILLALGVVLVLLVAGWFVITSGAFVKSFVLPRVGAALGAEVKAGDVAFSPFSKLELRQLTVTPPGAEPLLTADLVRVRYQLFAILGGRLAVDEILVESPKVSVTQNADGTTSLDALLKKSAPSSAAPAKPGPAPQVELASLRVNNGAMNFRSLAKDGSETRAAVTGLQLSADNIRNGAAGKLANAAQFRVTQGPAGGAPTNAFAATLNGSFDFTLTPDLLPATLGGGQKLAFTEATGGFAPFTGVALDASANLTPTELKSAAVQFTKGGAALGGLTAAGPLDMAKQEGRLQVELKGVDRNILNLAGAAFGLDFQNTALASVNTVEIAAGGQRFAVKGQLTGTQVSVRQDALTVPPVDVKADYDLTVDHAAGAATIRTLNLAGTQGGREVVRGALSQPMQINYGAAASAPDASFNLAVTDLRLADWAALLGTSLAGTLNATADLGVRGGGRDFGVKADATLAGVTGTLGEQPLRNVGGRLTADATVAAFADDTKRGLTAKAKLADTRGEAGAVRIDGVTAALDLDLGLPANRYQFRRALLQLEPTARAKNELSLTGEVDLTKPDAIAGALKLTAESLDLTRYYDLLQGNTQPVEQAPATPPPGPQTEPEAMKLPFGTFTVDASVGKLFLREIAATEVAARLAINGSRVDIEPVKLAINGAPVTAAVKLNLGVPGYEYDLKLNANGVPVGPIANSFVPALTGRIAGAIHAGADIRGAGVTGASLRKSLAGQMNLAVTNANLSLTTPNAQRSPLTVLFELLRAGLRIPEITSQPIMQITADAKLGGGKVEMTRAFAGSSALEVETRGDVTIADDLMQSPVNLPVELRLSRNLSDRARITPANTATNMAFVPLPPIASLGGTLGQLQPNVDRVQLGLLAARGIAGFVGGDAGGVVDAANELVRDPGRAVGNVLQGLLGGQRGATNAAGTNAAPAADPLGSAIKGIFGPKKK
ncbi:MAG: AsmA family protein [Limisphaerales bacterium]